ncbi:hypothetical protein N8I77_009607 [Diaporthe amygdali]|uniref:DUF6594 domain-containing protein n=1 Tax=Phomopsis amygdali TaxID=1214568 RepID=A0AAD9W3C2_PHOAM|nr:hypothetical protein N8I77_009607 [Diaporthe amygdali]
MEIEKRIDRMHQHAVNGGGDLDIQEAARRWETLVKQATEEDPEFRQDARVKMQLLCDLRAKIKEYQEALLLQSKIAHLRQPKERVLVALRHFFQIPTHLLLGKAKKFLDNKDDLVALKPQEIDYLSDFLKHHLVGKKEQASDGNYYSRLDESKVTTIVQVVTISAAALFLLGPILGLYFLRNAGAKLGVVVVFTAIFAVVLNLITSARRAESFAATAAICLAHQTQIRCRASGLRQ